MRLLTARSTVQAHLGEFLFPIIIIRMLYFLVLLFLSLQFANALTINLSGGKQQCIWEEGSIGDQLFASYEVTKGNYHNLVVSVSCERSLPFVD